MKTDLRPFTIPEAGLPKGGFQDRHWSSIISLGCCTRYRPIEHWLRLNTMLRAASKFGVRLGSRR